VEYDDPDLIVIDGGKGQLKMATEVLKELGRTDVPVVGMAKARTQGKFSDSEVVNSEERFFIPGRQNPVTFAIHSEAYQILVALRDEAHRFAIQYHRKLRESRTLESELDQISGLGEKKRQILLKHFGTLENLRHATIEDITQLRGFHRLLAERILLVLKDESPTEIIEDDVIS
jgi:excinuclease ABC subunit C